MRMLGLLLVTAALAGLGWLGYEYVMRPGGLPETPPATSAQSPGTSNAQGVRLIASVQRGWADGGASYRVRPTKRGRVAVGDDLQRAWRQAVAAGVPDRPGLEDQFLCHPLSVVARAKSTWDLEAWRPTVGLARTMLARCNPG